MTCSRTGEIGAVKALLARGANVNAKEPSHDQTALMWAAAQKHPQVVAGAGRARRGRAGALARLHADRHQRGDAAGGPRRAQLHGPARRQHAVAVCGAGGRRRVRAAPARGGGRRERRAAERHQRVGGGRPQRPAGGRCPAARQGRGPERRRGRLHGAPCGGAEKRSRPGEGAAGPRRESERTRSRRALRSGATARTSSCRRRSSARRPTCWPPSSSRSTSCACWRRAAPIRGCR